MLLTDDGQVENNAGLAQSEYRKLTVTGEPTDGYETESVL